jgi:DNA-directed RNA polymerase specialized sigma24 family protein
MPSMQGFATTHWSLIAAAADEDALRARAALEELCRTYWFPIYAFVRRQGFDSDRSQDLTQEFFTRFLERDFLAAADRGQGKFRSFLLACCKHFLANERDRDHAQKRGGGRVHVPIDSSLADSRYSNEPAHDQTAEKLFERRWACALLEQVLARLRLEFESPEKQRQFELLKGFLTGGGNTSHADVASELGMSAGAVKIAAHRLRRRYRELLREEIGRTVAEPDQIEDEIRALFAALGS